MASNHDYLALDWVRGEIEQTLLLAQNSLELFASNRDDTTHAGFCLSHLHQVRGTLQMVELYGAALLAEEMEMLCQAFIDKQIENFDESVDTLMGAILQLGNYLEHVQSGQKDLPLVLLPVLNDLRASRGQSFLSDSSLFTPNLSAAEVESNPALNARMADPKVVENLRKLRQKFQFSLASVVRNQDLGEHLDFIGKILARLDKFCKDTALGKLWWVATGFIDAVTASQEEPGSAVKHLLRELDLQLKSMIESPADALSRPVPKDLLRNLLYYVAKSDEQTPSIVALKTAFELEQALPNLNATEDDTTATLGPDASTINSVVAVLIEELAQVKDQLDLIERNDAAQTQDLRDLLPSLNQLASTLAVVGAGNARNGIVKQIDLIEALEDGAISDNVMMVIADAILVVEAQVMHLKDSPNALSESGDEFSVPYEHFQSAHAAVIAASRVSLEEAKNHIVAFITSQWDQSHIGGVPDLLDSIRGGLQIIPLDEAASLLGACSHYVREKLLNENVVPHWAELDRLADTISSIEYYIERIADGARDNDKFLKIARESLHKLGYLNQEDGQDMIVSEHHVSEAAAEAPDTKAKETDEELIDDEILEIFSEEVGDVSIEIGQAIAALRVDETKLPMLAELRRAFHTLKGSGRLVGAEAMAQLAWVIEDALNARCDSGVPISPGELDAVENVQAALPQLLENFSNGAHSELATTLENSFRAALGDESSEPEVESTVEDAAEETYDKVDEEAVEETAEDQVDQVAEVEPEPEIAAPSEIDLEAESADEPEDSLIDEEILEIFIEEAEEVNDTIQEFLPKFLEDYSDQEALTELRRAFHTLKGSGRMVEAADIGEIAWAIENLLNRVIENTITMRPSLGSLMQFVTDHIASLVDSFKNQTVAPISPELIETQAQKLIAGEDPEPLSADTSLEQSESVADAPEAIVVDEPEEVTVEDEPVVAREPLSKDQDSAEQITFDESLLEIFEAEATTHIASVVEFSSRVEEGKSVAVDDDLSRALHTLKGSANTANIKPIAQIAIPLEFLVKEVRAHHLKVDLRLATLMLAAMALVKKAVAQLSTSPQAEIEGTQAFLGELKKYQQHAVESLSHDEDLNIDGPQDPQLVNIFLTEGLDILLDAERLIDQWQAGSIAEEDFGKLKQEVNTLRRGAKVAGLGAIAALCKSLEACYQSIEQASNTPSQAFISAIKLGHDAIIDMMDQTAAGLTAERNAAALKHLDSMRSEFEAQEQEISLEESVELELPVEQETDLSETIEELESSLTQALPELELSAAEDLADGMSAEESTNENTSEEPVQGGSLADLDPELVEIFLEEAQDLIAHSAELLHQWELQSDDFTTVGELQRDLHTLKGGARMAEVSAIGDLAHELETLFEKTVESQSVAEPDVIALCLRCHDALAAMVDTIAQGGAPEMAIELTAAVQRSLSGEAIAEESVEIELEAPTESEPSEVVTEVPDVVEVAEDESVEITEMPSEDERVAEVADQGEVKDQEELEIPVEAPTEQSLKEEASQKSDEASTKVSKLAQELDENLDSDLLPLFIEESKDILNAVYESLEQWKTDEEGLAGVVDLQREMHTLKGGARLADVDEIAHLADANLRGIEAFLDGDLADYKALQSLSYKSHASLGTMLASLMVGQSAIPAADLVVDFDVLLAKSAPAAEPQVELEQSRSKQTKAEQQQEEDDWDQEVLEMFAEEAKELIETLEANLSEWSGSPAEQKFNQELQRVLHTLKGGARLASLDALADASHNLETRLIEGFESGEALEGELKEAVFKGQDQLHELVAAFTSGEPAEPVEESAAKKPQKAAPAPKSSKKEAPVKAKKAVVAKKAAPAKKADKRPAQQETVRVGANLIDTLVNLAGETSISRGRLEQQISDFGFTLEEMGATIERLREQLRRMEMETEAQVLYRAEQEGFNVAEYEEFDPLEMDRYSSIQQLSRSLTESTTDLLELRETLANRARDAETLLLQQSRINSELQEGLMRTRMIPFASMVPRLRRIVRQISGELDKQVEFEVSNAEGEMDRSVLERMIAPLEHMLRNALDHGIESKEARAKSGKSATGTIHLSLSREGGNIALRMKDDGAGIDDKYLLKKAIAQELVPADIQVTRQDVFQFIMLPGFSTAEQVTQISGRGVGMDVVASEIKQMGGTITIDSMLGKGTEFTVRLPFTVSVNRALMVSTGEDFYAIPLNSIEGIVRVSPFELEEYYKADAPPYEYAGQNYTLQYLGNLLHNSHQPKLKGQPLPLPVILVRGAEKPMALQVDSLMGSREIVVKSLGPQFGNVHGVSGATILGDGSVVVILDLPALIRDETAGVLDILDYQDTEHEHKNKAPLVMVVDDSVTVRKVTTRLLERNGLDVVTAKDGVDAIAQLQDCKPDVMLLDIEMPRMDGFEVATLVRHDERLKDVPIIMITSRTGQKHRDRAMSIGVNEYLGKPFQEKDLLSTIEAVRSDSKLLTH